MTRVGESDWSLLSGEWSRVYRGERLSISATCGAPATFAVRVGPFVVAGAWHTLRAAKRVAEREAVRRAESRVVCSQCRRARVDRDAKVCTVCATAEAAE